MNEGLENGDLFYFEFEMRMELMKLERQLNEALGGSENTQGLKY